MSSLNEISIFLQQGRAQNVKEAVQKALDEGMEAKDILNKGLLDGMNIIGEKFKKNQVYVPEVLIAARAMYAGMDILKPILTETGVESAGKVVIGTVKGDLHDIGKNLVKMMMEGRGLEVIDLGIDVAPEEFIEAAKEHNAKIIACSALLTTTMTQMKKVVELTIEHGIRDQVTIMVGGAPLPIISARVSAPIFTPGCCICCRSGRKSL